MFILQIKIRYNLSQLLHFLQFFKMARSLLVHLEQITFTINNKKRLTLTLSFNVTAGHWTLIIT